MQVFILIISFIIVLLFISFIYIIAQELGRSLGGIAGIPSETPYNTNTYNKETNVNAWRKKAATILDKEKCQPPRATFFGKIDGMEVTEEGNLEEKYLTAWELRYWKEQKAREEAIKAGILNEINDLTPK